ncbi:hypothetical protein ACQKH5_06365 [Hyphomonas sp. NPDC076900]|uniref:hypothetical protein n=1 Tax=unclassified Hyphomonas TaxID=2630699 RepID=UPI003D0159CE
MLVSFLSGSPALAVSAINRSLAEAVKLPRGVGVPSDTPVGIDEDALVIRKGAEGTGMEPMRWGFPPRSLTNRNGWNPPISQVHDLEDRWWRELNRPYLIEARHRCLVPVSAFAITQGGRQKRFFSERGLGFLAAFWRPWDGDTRLVSSPGETERRRVCSRLKLFAILAAQPVEGGRLRSDALPSVLTHPADIAEWMAGGEESLLNNPDSEGKNIVRAGDLV